MLTLIGRRLLAGVLVLWGACTLIFLIVRVAPGDPAAVMLGPDADPSQIAAMHAKLGLDKPMLVQYWDYLVQVLHLDFGDSYRLGTSAIDAVFSRLPATIDLTLTAAAISLFVGLVLGSAAGIRSGSLQDRIVTTVTIVLQSFPTFWIGIMLILVFSLGLRLLPSAGVHGIGSIVLPSVTLSFPFTAIVARVTRSGVAEAMSEPYVQTALSKGLTLRQVLTGHVLRNALIPVTTVVGLQVGALLGGAVVVENVFAWPGLGTLIVDSVGNRDYAVVQAATLTIAAIIVLLNLAADLLYGQLDPRIRMAVKS
ncbi:ABC transporter permease [Actinoallomurus iriomotensis]|uniref:Peptide ABC transporter permease n=1 Tax=Actinoallomurus iriomotensis TaxID=478107 RepID=A0A9W6VWR7_9ACTN|nr:ABC transporter permease [Actinoallomurus iriomotensis]GLY88133.1 peptide ABC transporter permease [Actinoallomurus iriomotensis]